MKKWEYKIVKIKFDKNDTIETEKELNTLGMLGWEVVSAPLHSLDGVVNYVTVAYTLKREIEE